MKFKQFKKEILDIANTDAYKKQLFRIGHHKCWQWEDDDDREIYHIPYWEEQSEGKNWWIKSKDDKIDAVVGVMYSPGGSDSGNCWGRKTKPYRNNESIPEFSLLDVIIQKYNPDIKFLEYKELVNKIQKKSEWTENEYYGNYTDRVAVYVETLDLFNYLKEKNWIENS